MQQPNGLKGEIGPERFAKLTRHLRVNGKPIVDLINCRPGSPGKPAPSPPQPLGDPNSPMLG